MGYIGMSSLKGYGFLKDRNKVSIFEHFALKLGMGLHFSLELGMFSVFLDQKKLVFHHYR